MSAAENMAKAMAFKEEGNVAFKKGDYKAAMVAYHQVCKPLRGSLQRPQPAPTAKTTAPMANHRQCLRRSCCASAAARLARDTWIRLPHYRSTLWLQ